jgi:hypothetical protein
MKVKFILSLTALLSAALSAQSPSTMTAATPSGAWQVNFDHRQNEPLKLDLAIDGRSVRGSYGGMEMQGEFVNGELTFATPETWRGFLKTAELGSEWQKEMYATVNYARPRPDGTLSGRSDVYIRGYGPQVIKFVTWTASRRPSR